MRVSEQVDALEVMGIDTHRYLCQPRILATVVGLPILVVVTEVIALATALIISTRALGVPEATFTYGLTRFFLAKDFFGGLAKAVLFGFIIGVNGCYQGYHVSGGAEAVGRATTRAVVMSGAIILVTNFVVAAVFFRT
jgi:phospholipid/cholesterol/gamma-HCH transport system permease protein